VIDDLPWQPSAPSPALARAGVSSSRAWTDYLRGQGYTQGELARVLEGDASQPGLLGAVRSGLQARQPDDRGPVAVVGLVVGYLERHPPMAVLELPVAPPRYLSPADMGRRLQATGTEHELGAEYSDQMTGVPWVAAQCSREQCGSMVIASALYRLVGLAAPLWRLVVLDGRTVAACPHPSHWHKGEPPAGTLDEQLPFDLWLAYDTTVRGRVRVRLNPIPGLPGVIRWDLRTALGYSSAGRRDSSWGARFRPTLGLLHTRALRRLDALDEATIRRGMALGDLPLDQAAELHGTLITRQEVLRGQLHALVSG
jgi:hypothetical protein